MINPTDGVIREDPKGSGYFNAPRGRRRHAGVDYTCLPGQDVKSPISGIVRRNAIPYAGDTYGGVVIENENMSIKMFYLELEQNLIGLPVQAGAVVGTAQDISAKYGREMIPHVHLQIDRIDPSLFVGKL